jgi:hypothetical protein
MPFKSKAQRRLFWAKENRGEISKKTVEEWEHATKNKKSLPEHVKAAQVQGQRYALALLGLALFTGCNFIESSAGKAALDFIVQTVVLILTPVALLFVKKLITELEKKTGLAASTHHVELLNQAVVNGIALAREQARKKLKLNEPALTGEAKRDIALNFVLETAREHKVPEMGRDYLINLIESHLNMTRDTFDSEQPPTEIVRVSLTPPNDEPKQ